MRARFGLSVRALPVVGALLLAALPPAHAQADAAAIAALEERVTELENTINELERKLVDIEQEGLKVKAPFNVVNESGQPIFQVISTGGQSTFVFIGGDGAGSGGSKILLEAGTGASPGGRISLMGASGGNIPVFQAGEVGGKATAIIGDKAAAHILLQSDSSMVEMTATQGEGRQVSTKIDGENAMVKAESNGNAAMLGDQGGTIGMVLELGGNPAGELSKWPDRQFASVRIYGSGGGIVSGLGTDINNPSQGLLTVFSNGDSNGVILNGEGTVKVLREGSEKIKLDAIKQTITMNSTVPEAIEMNGEKQSITVKGSGNHKMVVDGAKGFSVQSSDKKLATLGLKSGGGDNGQLLIFSASGSPVFQVTAQGNNGEVIVGDQNTPHIKMSTENGQAEVTAEGGGDNVISMIAAQGLAHLRADTSGYAVSLGKLDGQIGMIIEQGNKLMAEFSKPNDRNSASVRVYGGGGNIVAGMGGQSGDPETGLVVVNGPSDAQAMMTGVGWMGLKTGGNLKVVASAPDEVIALYGDGAQYIVTIAPGTNGGGNITTYDPGGTGVFSAGATPDGGTACVIHKGKIHCLGIGLPLMGGGN